MSDDGVGGRSGISWGDQESSVIMFFGMYRTLLVYCEMVDVDFGGNRWHVGWGKGSIFSLFDNYEWWGCRGLKHIFMRGWGQQPHFVFCLYRTLVVNDEIFDMENEANFLFLTRMSEDGVEGWSIFSWDPDKESRLVLFLVCIGIWWYTTRWWMW